MVETVVNVGDAKIFGNGACLSFGCNNCGSVGLGSVTVGTDFLLSVRCRRDGNSVLGLGARGKADHAAGDTSTGVTVCERALVATKTEIVGLLVKNDGSTDNALFTRKINKIVFLIDVGLSVFVGNSLSEVADMTVFFMVMLSTMISAIGVIVAASCSASITDVTESVHMETVLTGGNTPDVAENGCFGSRVLDKVEDTTNVAFLLRVFECAFSVNN